MIDYAFKGAYINKQPNIDDIYKIGDYYLRYMHSDNTFLNRVTDDLTFVAISSPRIMTNPYKFDESQYYKKNQSGNTTPEK